MKPKESVQVSGIWFRLGGAADKPEVLIEVDGAGYKVKPLSGDVGSSVFEFPCSEIINARPSMLGGVCFPKDDL